MHSADVIITLLGGSGKKQWTRSDILEIISEGLKIEKREAASKFDTLNSRNDFFEKINENPAKYIFSKSGLLKYNTINRLKKEEVHFRTDIEEFLRVYCWDQVTTCIMDHKEFLDINFNDLERGLPYIAEMIQDGNPREAIAKINTALQDTILPIEDDFRPKASIYNFGQTLQVEDLKQEYIGKFVEIEGRVVFQSMPKSELIVGAYECQRCNHVTFVDQKIHGMCVEPFICESDVCERKGPFMLLDPPDSKYVDAQEITIESLKGQVPLKVYLKGELCRPPWDRDAKVVKICGVVETRGTISRSGNKSNYFDLLVDASSIRFSDDSNTEPPTEEETQKFEDWAKNPQELRKNILESIAPNIYGMLDLKDIASLALFSDWNWNLDPRDVLERSSIHVLFFGDPGVAKSQIVKDVVYLSPKGKFAQVTNMTKGGLSTVAVQENGEWCVKSGFFSQADQGIAGLDEIDKVDDPKDLKCLVSVLDDQVQRVSKIGKNDIPFNTRAAVLATANPKTGHLTKSEIIEQIAGTIPSYIFQRFDVIFAIRDVPDKEKDRIIIKNINAIHSDHKTNRKTIKRQIPPELFRKYVLYARSKPVPEFAPDAQKLIEEYYMKLRQVSRDYPVIGARQGNNLNRISRAVARREMASIINEDHVNYAIGILKASLSTFSEGDDYTMYNFGRTKSQAERVNLIRNAVIEICRKEPNADIKEIAFVSGLDVLDVEHTLILMLNNKEIYKIKDGYRIP